MLVSALILQNGKSSSHKINEYLNQFADIAATGRPILLFLDPALTDKVSYPNVDVVPLGLTDLALYQRLRNFPGKKLPEHRNSEKDTYEYLVIQNSKADLVGRAIDRYPQCDRFSWIDCGITHFMKTPKETLGRLKEYDGLVFPGCWDLHAFVNNDTVDWRFCGSFFSGDHKSLIKFIGMNHHAIDMLLPKVTWEVNVWAHMELNELCKFSWYKADHDDSIFQGN